jgi:hypothetical protein
MMSILSFLMYSFSWVFLPLWPNPRKFHPMAFFWTPQKKLVLGELAYPSN